LPADPPLVFFPSLPLPRPPCPTHFPYTTLFRSVRRAVDEASRAGHRARPVPRAGDLPGEPRPGPLLCRLRGVPARRRPVPDDRLDRKSTRLNSSHVETSYAVFCLKKKNKTWG